MALLWQQEVHGWVLVEVVAEACPVTSLKWMQGQAQRTAAGRCWCLLYCWWAEQVGCAILLPAC